MFQRLRGVMEYRSGLLYTPLKSDVCSLGNGIEGMGRGKSFINRRVMIEATLDMTPTYSRMPKCINCAKVLNTV